MISAIHVLCWVLGASQGQIAQAWMSTQTMTKIIKKISPQTIAVRADKFFLLSHMKSSSLSMPPKTRLPLDASLSSTDLQRKAKLPSANMKSH